MPQTIERDELQRMIDKGESFTLIEVLRPDQFEEFHLPGAVNAPLTDQFEENVMDVVPRRDEQIVVYCWDADCDASEKAVNRLETAGYTNVRSYEEGKKAWRDAGLEVISPSSGLSPREEGKN